MVYPDDGQPSTPGGEHKIRLSPFAVVAMIDDGADTQSLMAYRFPSRYGGEQAAVVAVAVLAPANEATKIAVISGTNWTATMMQNNDNQKTSII